MIEFYNKIFTGSENRKSLYDILIPKNPKAFIIFMHGYKGFKDWGTWNLVAKEFANSGYIFLKFNASHNGGTKENPIDFPDLEAFGKNDYTKELVDLKKITNLAEKILVENKIEVPIYLIGHSRAGGVGIIHASMDERIKKMVSWAGISDFESRFPEGDDLVDWKEFGVRYVENTRTKQMMPHFYSFYENFIENRDVLDIEKACRLLKIPFLQIHGDMDLSVSISEGLKIAEWTNTELEIIKGADHTFETKHPWDEEDLPADMLKVIGKTIDFLER